MLISFRTLLFTFILYVYQKPLYVICPLHVLYFIMKMAYIDNVCYSIHSICIVIKYAQLDIFLKYREMLFIFQILFDDERVHFCPI